MNQEEEMYVEGYAIVFNQKTLLYQYDDVKIYEIIDQKALDGADISNVSFKYNHSNEVLIVASTRNKSLELIVDQKGLKIRARLVNTQVGRDLYEMIKTKLLQKMSFAFTADKEEWDAQSKTRKILSFQKIYDVSAVTDPAYPTTSLYVLNEEQIGNLRSSEREIELLKMKIQIKGKC